MAIKNNSKLLKQAEFEMSQNTQNMDGVASSHHYMQDQMINQSNMIATNEMNSDNGINKAKLIH